MEKEKLDIINYIEFGVGGFIFIVFVLFTFTIKRNSDNIFFSMRSSNLMIITNTLIFLSFASYILNDTFYDDYQNTGHLKFLSALYSVFQIGVFIALVLRYFRLFLSCRNPEDSQNVQYNLFETKFYHYEYFYVRVILLSVIITLIVSIINYFAGNNNIAMFAFEIEFNKSKEGIDGLYYFWIIFSSIQTVFFITFALLIAKTHLNPDVYITQEISLVALINYLYSLSICISFIIDKNGKGDMNLFVRFIPMIYNLLIYFIVIALPFLYGVFNSTVIIYDLPGELCSSLYLFLTKEKCFDVFHNYLKTIDPENEKSVFLLDLLICIFKFRLLVTNNEPQDSQREEFDNIVVHYLGRNQTKNFINEGLVKEITDTSDLARNAKKIKANIFDKIAGEAYQFLDQKFKDFRDTEQFADLKNELTEETNIRCKLTNFGLIRN